MFKFFVVFACLMAMCSAATIMITPKNGRMGDDQTVEILKSVSEHNLDGSYMFVFEGSDGSARQETARLNHKEMEDGEVADVLEVSGSYRYIDADGQTIEVNYTAGENGFIVQGTNILPEITAAVKASAANAEYARQHPELKLTAKKST